MDTLLAKETQNGMTLQELKAKVDATIEVEKAAVVLIQGIAAQLAAAKNDPAAIQALADSLDSEAGELSAAITANTPAA